MEDIEDRRTMITLPALMHDKIKMLGIEQRKSMNHLVRQAIREFLVKHEKDISYGRR